MKRRSESIALGYFFLGIYAGVAGALVWNAVDSRFKRLEQRPSSPKTIGAAASTIDLDERMRQIRRDSAHDFAEALREEGLVIKEETS